jgi:hypothetical protein
MNASAIRPAAGGTRPARSGSRFRKLACALMVLPAAVFCAAASASPQRESPVDECVQAAVARMGIELTQRIEGTLQVRGDAETSRVVYLDVESEEARLPVRMRLYCSVNESGEIEHVLSMPRLMHAG